MSFDCTLPPKLALLHTLPVEYNHGDGIDFEPYDKFQSADDNASWIKAWTGNAIQTGVEYRVFGQDGSGGYAAFWLVRPVTDILLQPIVFFGSEGELGVVAVDFADYLWLLAHNTGPFEAVAYGARDQRNAAFDAFASTHAMTAKKSGAEVLTRAKSDFPDFEKMIRALITY
jgi:hypothetical protein